MLENGVEVGLTISLMCELIVHCFLIHFGLGEKCMV